MAMPAARATGWPQRRLVLAALAVSVVLNVLFIAGAVWSRIEGPPARGFAQRFDRIGAELALDPQQRQALDRLVAAMQARRDEARQQIAGLYAAAWDEAGKPNAETAEVLRRFDEAFERRRKLNRETIVEALDFLATLPPEQRAKFVALARERRGGSRR